MGGNPQVSHPYDRAESKRVAITGSSGLIGTALTTSLRADGHQVVRMLRQGAHSDGSALHWDPANGEIDAGGLEGIDAVIHLAGAGIGDQRWTDDRKKEILVSRVLSTSLLARTLASMKAPPKVLLSGSAIGLYGDRGDEVCTESTAAGAGFLPDVCRAWEAATQPAETAGIRVVHLRTGLVQSVDGGMMKKSLPLFKLGLGGRFGDGRQWWSWISIADEVDAIRFLLDAEVEGPVNLTAPEPVTNSDYTKILGRVLRRPTLLPIPSIGPRILLGTEAALALIFEGQRVLPTVLEQAGYTFTHRTLESALRDILA